jgi:ferredoxin
MRIEIDRDRCIGSASCVHVAPDVFQLDEDRIAIVVDPHGAPEERVREAARNCPTEAILLADEHGRQVAP